MLRVRVWKDEIEVWFCHKVLQPYEVENMTGKCVDEPRRCTLVETKINGSYFTSGVAVCHPNDNFRKATGRKTALADALIGFHKDQRIAVWNEYHKHCCI